LQGALAGCAGGGARGAGRDDAPLYCLPPTQSNIVRLHGIVNCDTVNKARAWLDANRVAYEWVDLRKSPPSADDLARWCKAVGWQTLLNRRGTTWRTLDDATKAAVVDEPTAIALMRARPTMIKRPVVEAAGGVVVGFSEEAYAKRFAR